jgi:hypothetical protein
MPSFEIFNPNFGSEITRFFDRTHIDVRMLPQIVIERSGARLARSNNKEIGHRRRVHGANFG